ncbi:MAG: hypothetical protein ACREKE_10390 [bacterium]
MRRIALGCAVAGVLALAACAEPSLSPHKDRGTKPVPGIPALKANPQPTPQALYPQRRPLDQDRPLKVRSRALRYDRESGETVFYGGVTATQDTTVLLSKELRSKGEGQAARALGGVLVVDKSRRLRMRAGEADYTGSLGEARLLDGVRLVSVDPYGDPITVTGRSGSYSDLSRFAEVDGGVNVLRGPLKARARSAVVTDGGVELLLEKDVRAAMGINRLQSQEARFNQKEHWVDLLGDVRVRLIPNQVRAAAAAPWALSPTAKEAP